MVLWALAEIVPILFERHARRKTIGTFVQCTQGGKDAGKTGNLDGQAILEACSEACERRVFTR
jgi:hypothetical protein